LRVKEQETRLTLYEHDDDDDDDDDDDCVIYRRSDAFYMADNEGKDTSKVHKIYNYFYI
jgi:hypothetical protein